MQKEIFKLAIIAVSTVSMLMLPVSGQAATKTRGQLSAEGFKTCKAIKVGYKARVTGYEYDLRGKKKNFNISYCFQTKSQCDKFVGRIRNVLYPVEEISNARCYTRG